MALVPVSPAGNAGFVTDVEPHELGLTVWTKALNMRTKNNAMERLPRDAAIYAGAPIEGYFAIPCRDVSGNILWLYAGLAKVYCASGAGHSDITRAVGGDYSATVTGRWTGGILAGVPFLNNGIDVPQMWSNPSAATKLTALTAWPSTARCAVLSAFKNYLVALDITKSGTRYSTLVKWSHPADPGAVPSSWDEADPTKDAGEYPLSETPGAAVDMLPMRDVNLIYKKDSVWGMQYIGGTYIFRFYKIFDQFGAPAKGFMCQIDKARHLVFTGDDLIVHDGQTYQSIADDRLRSYLRAIPEDSYAYTFLVDNPLRSEAWLCYRSSAAVDYCDKVLIWNWKDNTFTERTCSPGVHWITKGPIGTDATGTGTWASDGNSWSSDTTVWDDAAAFPELFKLFGCTANGLWNIDGGVTDTTESVLERTGLGVPLKVGAPPDISSNKFCSRFWPRISGDTGTVLEITVGFQTHIGDPITWKTGKTFTVGVSKKVDVTLSGRLMALRIRSTTPGMWRLHGIDWDVAFLGDM